MGRIVTNMCNNVRIFEYYVKIILGMTPSLQMVLFVAIMCGSIGGIVVASILKLLDNVVKVSYTLYRIQQCSFYIFTHQIAFILKGLIIFQEYSGSTANILTAILCSILFPDKFELTPYIMLSMGCLLSGIYLYESQKLKPNNSIDPSTNKQLSNETKG